MKTPKIAPTAKDFPPPQRMDNPISPECLIRWTVGNTYLQVFHPDSVAGDKGDKNYDRYGRAYSKFTDDVLYLKENHA